MMMINHWDSNYIFMTNSLIIIFDTVILPLSSSSSSYEMLVWWLSFINEDDEVNRMFEILLWNTIWNVIFVYCETRKKDLVIIINVDGSYVLCMHFQKKRMKINLKHNISIILKSYNHHSRRFFQSISFLYVCWRLGETTTKKDKCHSFFSIGDAMDVSCFK